MSRASLACPEGSRTALSRQGSPALSGIDHIAASAKSAVKDLANAQRHIHLVERERIFLAGMSSGDLAEAIQHIKNEHRLLGPR